MQRFVIAVVCFSFCASGCALRNNSSLPQSDHLVRDQLVFNCDFRLPRKHRLLDELTAKRTDISERLLLPTSDEPINVFLFEDENRFRKYMQKHHPTFPRRRAFFVKNDTKLNVYAFWGDKIGEDLRHEIAHGYMHSVVPNLPLWLDEGLAEYFEVPRGKRGFNRGHIYHLVTELKNERWEPDLKRLEQLSSAHEMTQLDYAESWLWIHYLLEASPEHAKLIQDQLARLRMLGEAAPLSQAVDKLAENSNQKVLDHLAMLAEQL